jgi:tRNA modification GTPase
MNQDQTIFAVSSGFGRAGVTVVRISGPKAGDVFGLFHVSKSSPRTAAVRRLKGADGVVVDEALVLWLPGPGTATGEDMAELHLHGAPAVVGAVLAVLGRADGFALAEAGDFTKRSFRNRKLDLLQVEGLADVLASETDSQRRLAMRQFLGEASSVFENWRSDLVRAVALVEAAIDFSDEDDVSGRAVGEAREVISVLVDRFDSALEQSGRASQVRRGLRVVLAGPPNAGKSSLLNWLVGRETAIVSPVAGTTRDVVEASIVVGGAPLLIADTAGLREGSGDAIEQEGMRRTLRAVDDADILIWVTAVGGKEEALPPRRPEFSVVNKMDLLSDRGSAVLDPEVWPVSARSGQGLAPLRDALESLIRERNHLGEDAVVVRHRHRVALEQAVSHLHHALQSEVLGLELMAEDMRKAAVSLAGVTGRVDVEDLLGEIFSAFCIGK